MSHWCQHSWNTMALGTMGKFVSKACSGRTTKEPSRSAVQSGSHAYWLVKISSLLGASRLSTLRLNHCRPRFDRRSLCSSAGTAIISFFTVGPRSSGPDTPSSQQRQDGLKQGNQPVAVVVTTGALATAQVCMSCLHRGDGNCQWHTAVVPHLHILGRDLCQAAGSKVAAVWGLVGGLEGCLLLQLRVATSPCCGSCNKKTQRGPEPLA